MLSSGRFLSWGVYDFVVEYTAIREDIEEGVKDRMRGI